ncbi:MAG: hypothetical protein EOO13_18280, partial [Chitinophagaceae bacterium]
MKFFLFCLGAIGAGLPLHSAAQYVGRDDVFPDRAGKVIAFKATYSGTTDTVYFVDVATGVITERVADGSFGLEFKMLKAKVLNREKEMMKSLTAFSTFAFFDRGNVDRYFVRWKKDSTVASAWLPKVERHTHDPKIFIKYDNPRKVLLGVRLNRDAMLYDMLDTTAQGMARLLYSKDLSKADYQEFDHGHMQQAVISPTGGHIFTMPDGTMIDLVKGKKIWDFNYKKTGSSDVVFSKDGTHIAIEHQDKSVTVYDVQKGKRLYKIPAPPMFPGELKVEHLLPLPDMQTCFVFYMDFKKRSAKV